MLFGRHASRASEAAFPNLWDGLVGAWCPSISGSTGLSLLNLSQWSHNGTLTNMDVATDWSSSMGYGCLDFDGTNDQVITRTPAAISVTSGTIACWMRHPGTAVDSAMIKCGAAASNNGFGICLGANTTVNGTGVYLRFINAGVSWYSSGVTVSSNVWHHVALTMAAGNIQNLYLDGVSVLNRTGALNQQAGTELYIGGYTISSFPRYHMGQLDDVVAYNRPLSHSEIDTLAKQRGSLYRLKPRTAVGVADVNAVANDVTAAAVIVGSPAATVTVTATANGVTSGAAAVGSPAATITVSAVANDVTASAIESGSPAASITVAATANSITADEAVIGSPAASVIVNATPNNITSATPLVGEPEAYVGDRVDAVPNNIAASAAIVGEPSAAITVNATPNDIECVAVVSQPVATVIIDFAANDVLASAITVDSPAATIIVNAVANSIYAGTSTIGSPSATITVHATPNNVTCGIITISESPLVSICVEKWAIYVPGMLATAVYAPGSRADYAYQPGSQADATYSPGGIDGVSCPGTKATQVGCHK